MHLCITCTHQYRNKDKVSNTNKGNSYSSNSNSSLLSFLISDFTFHQAKAMKQVASRQ